MDRAACLGAPLPHSVTVTDEKQERTGDRQRHLLSNVVNKPLTNLTEMQIVVCAQAVGAAF